MQLYIKIQLKIHTYSNLQVSNLKHTYRTSDIYGLIFLTIIFACGLHEIMMRTSPPTLLESCVTAGYLIFYAMLFNRIYGLFKSI